MLNKIRKKIWDVLVRWRTYLVNALFAVAGALVVSPELLQFLVGFDFGNVVPKEYVGLVVFAQGLANVWMRPRLASRKHDPEVQYKISTK